jgi:AcrR family transcriptional regulator
MPRPRQVPRSKRRIPRQARAGETVASILEATAQILEAGGLGALTTNAIAERAGVSIGTLYQYFADKNAILLALARQEMEATLIAVARSQENPSDPTVEGRVRATVRSILNAFRGRMRARKAVVQAILAQGLAIEVMGPVATFIATQPRTVLPELTKEQVFVLSRAMLGTIRAAVMEEQPFLRSRDFEDEVVRLIVAYIAAVRSASTGATSRSAAAR